MDDGRNRPHRRALPIGTRRSIHPADRNSADALPCQLEDACGAAASAKHAGLPRSGRGSRWLRVRGCLLARFQEGVRRRTRYLAAVPMTRSARSHSRSFSIARGSSQPATSGSFNPNLSEKLESPRSLGPVGARIRPVGTFAGDGFSRPSGTAARRKIRYVRRVLSRLGQLQAGRSRWRQRAVARGRWRTIHGLPPRLW